MLDLHVIIHPDTPEAWQRECLSSVRAAIARAGFDVALHFVEGEDGHIGRGRARGYALGGFPWATCVDDDDLILPDSLRGMRPGLESSALAVSVLEMESRGGLVRLGGRRHHLSAYRRIALIEHTGWACCGDVAQARSIPDGAWFDCDVVGYVWRVYPSSKARAMRRANSAELELANAQPTL